MSYLDFMKKLQDFAATIALARQEGATKKALRPYSEALDIYNDSRELWQMKIHCPLLFDPTERCSMAVGADAIPDMAKKYGVPYPIEAPSQPLSSSSPSLDEWTTYRSKQCYANRQVFETLLSTIWEKARQKAKGR